MLLRRLRRGPEGERGSFAVLFAILVTALFTMTALAVDMSDARARVRDNQSRADFAALAGAPHLPEDPQAACEAAWTYLILNTPGIPTTATSPCASGVPGSWPDADSCAADPVAREYQALNAEPFEVVFVYPVPDDHELMTANGRTTVPDYDGKLPCQRIAVKIRHKGKALFGGIVGSQGLVAPATAVVRGFGSGHRDLSLALLLLDPIGCTSLLASGNGGVVVYPFENFPGFIAVDSDASHQQCQPSGSWTTDANGTNPKIWSCGIGTIPGSPCTDGGDIVIHAMRRGQRTCDTGNLNACDPADVTGGRLIPQPRENPKRISRAPVDHHVNCQTGYPDYHGIVPIPDCPDPVSDPTLPDRDGDGFTSDYIDELRHALATGTSKPPGYLEYGPGAGADVQGPCARNPGDDLTLPPGNWFVNCPTSFNVSAHVVFQGGNIVFQGGIRLGSQGSLSVNTAPDPASSLPAYCKEQPDGSRPRGICPNDYSPLATTVVLRNGSIDRSAQAPLIMENTFVYLRSGRVNLAGGNAAFRWSAPFEGPFEPITLWSESSQVHNLAGQANQDLDGVFFVPNATIDYAGSSAQDQVNAQFISYRLIARGNGSLLLSVNPERSIPFPIRGHYLIR